MMLMIRQQNNFYPIICVILTCILLIVFALYDFHLNIYLYDRSLKGSVHQCKLPTSHNKNHHHHQKVARNKKYNVNNEHKINELLRNIQNAPNTINENHLRVVVLPINSRNSPKRQHAPIDDILKRFIHDTAARPPLAIKIAKPKKRLPIIRLHKKRNRRPQIRRIQLLNFDEQLLKNPVYKRKDGFDEFLKKLVNHLPVSPFAPSPPHTINANPKIPIKIHFQIKNNKTFKRPKVRIIRRMNILNNDTKPKTTKRQGFSELLKNIIHKQVIEKIPSKMGAYNNFRNPMKLVIRMKKNGTIPLFKTNNGDPLKPKKSTVKTKKFGFNEFFKKLTHASNLFPFAPVAPFAPFAPFGIGDKHIEKQPLKIVLHMKNNKNNPILESKRLTDNTNVTQKDNALNAFFQNIKNKNVVNLPVRTPGLFHRIIKRPQKNIVMRLNNNETKPVIRVHRFMF